MQFMNVFTSSAQSPPSARHASLALARSAQGSADSSDWAWDTNSAWKETLFYSLGIIMVNVMRIIKYEC